VVPTSRIVWWRFQGGEKAPHHGEDVVEVPDELEVRAAGGLLVRRTERPGYLPLEAARPGVDQIGEPLPDVLRCRLPSEGKREHPPELVNAPPPPLHIGQPSHDRVPPHRTTSAYQDGSLSL